MDTRTPLSMDAAATVFGDQPFFDQTVALLGGVRDHDFDTLAELCDDDFGIVDIDVTGAARPIRDRAEWEEWFTTLFATMQGMGAATDSFILDYRALSHDTLGFGVLEFRQTLTVGPYEAVFDCVATLVWKLTPQGWREARWHASVVSSHVPDELLAPATN